MKRLMMLGGRGDLAFDGEIKPYIGQVVTVIKQCKNGLYQIETRDKKLFSVSIRNLDPFWTEERLKKFWEVYHLELEEATAEETKKLQE